MGAIYRFNHDHWNYDQAYAEMKHFDFYTSNGHGKAADLFQDYWQDFRLNRQGSCPLAKENNHVMRKGRFGRPFLFTCRLEDGIFETPGRRR